MKPTLCKPRNTPGFFPANRKKGEYTTMEFNTLNLHAHIAAGIKAAGYTVQTPIQALAIPPALRKQDVMGLAQTGTGKTTA